MNESLSQEEVDKIVSDVAEAYGVDKEDVQIEVVYETSGTIDVDITGDVSQQELEEAIQDELANLLGIHESKIEVSIKNGTAHFTIKSDSAETAKDIQSTLSSAETASSLNDSISSSYPVTVSGMTVNGEVTADVVVTVDTTDAANNLKDAAEKITTAMEKEGYEASAKSKFNPS